VAANEKKLEELRVRAIASDFNKSNPQPAPTKEKKSRTNNKHSEDSDTSEYLVEQDVQGDSDDDDSEFESESESIQQPMPLAIKVVISMFVICSLLHFLPIDASSNLLHTCYFIFFLLLIHARHLYCFYTVS
jgi:hypothetical protein